jgi:redox-sensitive bicupin YhaK (pirin superfamily)
MESHVLHKSNSRGFANLGWLKSYHTFSFGGYYDPQRVNFGALRVLNDDTVDAGMGFDTHPHKNMEIVSIPLEGTLLHKDNMGNSSIIKKGDVQVMSAGMGVFHSEYNADNNEHVKFLQIWIIPNKMNVTPRYQQITLNTSESENKLQQILSPHMEEQGVWIHQNAWFHLGKFDEGVKTTYTLKNNIHNGVYIFVLNGDINVSGQQLSTRDGYGIWDITELEITSISQSEFLVMEVPMNI